MENNRVAEGFFFYTERDAVLARQEQKKVEYLEERMDYSNPESVLKLYTRAIRERIFKTPVGMLYLKRLQQFLTEQEGINREEIVPIPMYVTYDGELRERTNPAKRRIQPAQKEEKKSIALPMSIIVNIALAASVIAMFVIALTSSQPNILNYERNLVNQYASWEQELTEREQAVREKELELKLQK